MQVSCETCIPFDDEDGIYVSLSYFRQKNGEQM